MRTRRKIGVMIGITMLCVASFLVGAYYIRSTHLESLPSGNGCGIVDANASHTVILSDLAAENLYIILIAEGDIWFEYIPQYTDPNKTGLADYEEQLQASWAYLWQSEGRGGRSAAIVNRCIVVLSAIAADYITLTFNAAWTTDYNATEFSYSYWWDNEHRSPWDIDPSLGVPWWVEYPPDTET